MMKLCAACNYDGTSGPRTAPTNITKAGLYWVKANSTIDGELYQVSGALFVAKENTNKRLFFPCTTCFISEIDKIRTPTNVRIYLANKVLSSVENGRFLNIEVRSFNPHTFSHGPRYNAYPVRGVCE